MRGRTRLQRGLLTFFATGGTLAAALGTWAFAWEPSSLRMVEYEVAIDDWPAACDGLRVAVLADLHTGSPWNGLAKLDRIVDRTLDAEPELVLLAGDFVIHGVVGGRFIAPEDAAARLARLTAPLGTFGVLGNHDWWLGADRVARAMEENGVRMLEDAALPLRRGGCEFWLAGVTDLWEGPHHVERALAHVPEGETTVAFTHNPDVFPEIPGRVALTFAGHTHGGQVALPFVGRPGVPSAYGERFALGHVHEGGRDLFVSPGLGTSILPVRFRVPPEISIVTVRSSGEGGAP